MRIFSGIQPTGKLHIGNYLGAIKQWISLQEKNECVFCIVDLHAITVPYNPEELKKSALETTIAYLAAGIDPEKSIIFIQSQVKEHTELCWLLNTITPLGELYRMTQYKEKTEKYKKAAGAGLLNYPLLMAADILLYDTEIVPVGEDQAQHVELTQGIAQKFNHKFGQTFILPRVKLPEKGARIMSLSEPKTKMSKSGTKENYISLFDAPEDIKKKIMSAKTDTEKTIKYDPVKKPGISNLITIYSIFSEKKTEQIEKEMKGKSYKEFKEEVMGLVIEKLDPFRRKREELLNKEDYVENVLRQGAERARLIAEEKMNKIRKKMGI